MQNRIDRLESLVLSLMHGGANLDPSTVAAASSAVTGMTTAATTAAATMSSSSATKIDISEDGAMKDDEGNDSDSDEELSTSLGFLKVDTDHGKSMYIGQENWHTILADIAEVRNYYTAHKKDLERSYENILLSKPAIVRDGPAFLLGVRPASEVELRAELPPKSSVMTLCSRYFNSIDNAVNIIHSPTFHQQLREHWQNPSKTPIMWLGMLYSILTLAMLSYHKVGDEPVEWKGRTLELAAEYRLRTVQCLITADYTKAVDYTVETMILYLFGEYSSRWDADLALWLISSLITRIALRMGYHRDAKWFPSVTPFQAEMRRRVWVLVRLSDITFSHRVSLPSMIHDEDCDTEEPHNLFDEEFGPQTKVMPPSRPNSEPTPISYMISKYKLTLELGNILQATGRLKNPPHYDEIIRFDARLRQVKSELPPHLKLMPLEQLQDPLTLIIARFNIQLLYLKILCVLHRKYMSRARHNHRYVYSRRTAIEASMETLAHLQTLHRESQPNGRLRNIHWFVSSIATKDFLLPAMLVVLDLHHDTAAQCPQSGSHEQPFWTAEQRAEMISSLEKTRDIWKELDGSSMEAVKASNILQIMLEKIKNPGSEKNTPNSVPDSVPSLASLTSSNEAQPGKEASPLGLGMLPSGAMSPNTGLLSQTLQGMGGSTQGTADLGLSLGGQPTTEFPSEFSASALGMDMPASPFSMFNSNNNLDFTANNFDWDAIENFAQSANWGTDQSFPFFSGNTDF
ncbi:hypothetical protein VTK73DRAFT_7623 [Phialemonium thermophilum]|uniref:Xylanolytic transcriptional activator regulatory domain-containing protein n=1 Tax=Phialemonium thermophilum TaxID=223376 RepID=A0ABR3Y7E2_9PEZI